MKITHTEAKHRAQRFKQLVVVKLLQHIESDDISIQQIAKLTRISQERISVLLNPAVIVLDLFVLFSVCAVLGLQVKFNNRPIGHK